MFVPFLTHMKERDLFLFSDIVCMLQCLENQHEGCTRADAGEEASFVKKKDMAAMLKLTY